MPRITKEQQKNKRASTIVMIIGALFLILIIVLIFTTPKAEEGDTTGDKTATDDTNDVITTVVNDFYECSDAGYAVMESFPARCIDSEGTEHVQPTGTVLENGDEIVIEKPLLGAEITSPITIIGRARGSWFFEADFPVSLKDDTGKVVAEGYVSTTDDWMTNDFISFTATLTFEVPLGITRGELVFEASNPSGLSDTAKNLRYPVRFNRSSE